MYSILHGVGLQQLLLLTAWLQVCAAFFVLYFCKIPFCWLQFSACRRANTQTAFCPAHETIPTSKQPRCSLPFLMSFFSSSFGFYSRRRLNAGVNTERSVRRNTKKKKKRSVVCVRRVLSICKSILWYVYFASTRHGVCAYSVRALCTKTKRCVSLVCSAAGSGQQIHKVGSTKHRVGRRGGWLSNKASAYKLPLELGGTGVM